MSDIEVVLPDGSSRSLPQGSTTADLAAGIARGLAKRAVAAVVDGEEWDLGRPLPGGGQRLQVWLKRSVRSARIELRGSTPLKAPTGETAFDLPAPRLLGLERGEAPTTIELIAS